MGDLMDMPIILDNTGDILTLRLTPEDQARAQNAYVFDYGSLLKKSEAKHKQKPLQFGSVSGGIQQRLKLSIQNRKSTRFLAHDNARDLEKCTTALPPPKSEAQIKMEHRKAQLEKWREEKKQKKKEEASSKKKPFLTGIPKNTLNFLPPPPPPKPSTSGRVTRSQTRSTIKPKSPVKSNQKAVSFAPKNATFKPPEFTNLAKLPKLAPVSKSIKTTATTQWSFDPVVSTTNAQPSTSQRQNAKPVAMETRSTRGRFTKRPSPKKIAKSTLTSNSSESDIEPNKLINRIQTPGAKKNLQKHKDLTPKLLIMKSSSVETCSGTESDTPSRRKSARKSRPEGSQSRPENLARESLPSQESQSSSGNNSSSEEKTISKVDIRNRRNLANNFIIPSTSDSSMKLSSDSEKSPTVVLNRSLPRTPSDKVIPRSESSSENKLRSPRTDIAVLTPEQKESAKISPCVTMSRGKDNARREMKWKIDEGLLDDDASDMECLDYFRKQLSSEVKRMTELCEIWDKISTQTALPEAIQEAVLAAVGQARLLMSSKLQQFAGLVEKCANPEPGSALITPADLRGFWDMVFIQVSNVDLRFKKLEETRARNWREDEPKAARAPEARRAKPKGVMGAKPKAAGSRIKDMIAAARKTMKEKQGQTSSDDSSPLSAPSTSPTQEKTFEAGFFCVRSPVRSPRPPGTPVTPAGNNLLKAVLSNEAKKASASKQLTNVMLHASRIGKQVENEGVAPLPLTPQMTPVNLYAAPSRSILKSANAQSAKSDRKSVKTVLFNDSSEESDSNQSYIRDSAISGIMALEKTLSNESEKNEPIILEEKENTRILRSTTRSDRKSLHNISNIQASTEVKTPKSATKKSKNTKETLITENVNTPRSATKNKVNRNETPIIENITPITEKKSSKRGSSKKSTSKKTKQASINTAPIEEKRKLLQRQKAMEETQEIDLTETSNKSMEPTSANNQSSEANKALEGIEIFYSAEQSTLPNELEDLMSTTTPSLANKALNELESGFEGLQPVTPKSNLLVESTSTSKRSVRNKALKELDLELEPKTPETEILKESASTSKKSARINKALEKTALESETTTPTTKLLEESTSTTKKSLKSNKALEKTALESEPTTPTTELLVESASTSKKSVRNKALRGLNMSGFDEEKLMGSTSKRSSRRKKAVC